MSRTTNVMAGFLAGAAAGVMTGVLVAPGKGSRTRKKIKYKVQDATRSFAETISDQISFLEERIKNLRRKAEETSKKPAHRTAAEAAMNEGPEPLM